MALAAKRSNVATPRGNLVTPKRTIGISGTSNPVTASQINGHTQPVNVQHDITGVVENQPLLTPMPKRRSIVDSQYVPLSHIIVNAEGDKWPVNYYKQNIGLNDELMPLAQGTAAAHQQYTKYCEFIVHVMSPLTQQQESETKEFTITGEATMFFGLVPNKGDMFVADIGNGKAGMFTITETERLTYTKEACYTIRYVMTDEYTPVLETQIESKVIRTYYFELALAELNESPFLTESDYHTYINLNEQESFLRSYFERAFWSRIAGNIALPQQNVLTHDAQHAIFCANVGLGSPRHPIIAYTNGYMANSEIYTLWDVFKDMELGQLSYAHQTFGITTAATFQEVTIARGIAWSQYGYTVYPTPDFFTPNDTESVKTAVGIIKPNGGVGVTDKYNNGVCMVDQSVIDENRLILPPVSPSGNRPLSEGGADVDVDVDDSEWNPEPTWEPVKPEPTPIFPAIGNSLYYVFSENFYNQTGSLSRFEQTATVMLKGQPIATKEVSVFCNAVRKCSLLQQFYFIPILLLMIKYSKRGSM